MTAESGMKSKVFQGIERRRPGGFTLIEILIVIVIMGLLISLVAPTLFSKVSSSQRKTTMAQMKMISTALDTFRLDIGSYPDNLEELRSSDRPGWDGPYLPRVIPADPWGNPYVYLKTGDSKAPYQLSSYAAGGSPGGDDDEADIVFQ